jgi:hypothetical protein
MEPWEQWEREHSYEGDEPDGDHRARAKGMAEIAITPYLGDPLCTEYARFCEIGADLIDSMKDENTRSEVVRDLVLGNFQNWNKRIAVLASIIESVTLKEDSKEDQEE